LSISVGEDGRVLLHCHAGCAPEGIVAALGLEMRDLFPLDSARSAAHIAYDYRDEHGNLLYQSIRFCSNGAKDFRQRRPDGAGGWIWKMQGVRRLCYRLNKLQGKEAIVIVEGEKDADRLWSIGLPATTNSGGAGKWQEDLTKQIVAAGAKRIVVLPDNDPPGEAHGRQVARSCHDAGLFVKLLPLPDLPSRGGDVSDWLDAGKTKAELLSLIRNAPPFNPDAHLVAKSVSLELTSLSELLSEPDDAIQWLVEDRIPWGSVVLLAGKPKAGKSVLARNLAYAVATGHRWLGHPTESGTVWYLALEDKRSELRRHFRMMGARAEQDVPIKILTGQAPEDILRKLHELAAKDKPALIIVDTLQRLIQAKDMSDYAEVTTRFAPILKLARDTNASVMVVHHAKKAGEGMDAILGSTALAGSVDNVFMLSRGEQYRSLSSIQRIGDDLEPAVVMMDKDTGHCSLAGSEKDMKTNDAAAKLLEVLNGQAEPVTERWLRDQVEAHPTDQARALRTLFRRGHVQRSGAGKRGDPFVYQAVVNQPHPDTERIKISGSRDLEKSPLDLNQKKLLETNDLSPKSISGSSGSIRYLDPENHLFPDPASADLAPVRTAAEGHLRLVATSEVKTGTTGHQRTRIEPIATSVYSGSEDYERAGFTPEPTEGEDDDGV
jgi:archaellum biogenesis ATPase FlaH